MVFEARTGALVSLNREAARIVKSLCDPGQSAEQLLGIITCRRLLDAGRIETGTLSVAPEPSDVAVLVDQARGTFISGGGRHTVRIDLPPDLPRVMADRQRLVQVLNNLLANAARHSPESAPIRITAEREGLDVAVSVADEGRGIAPDQLGRLFRKYSTAGDRAGDLGSGLGLAICKGLVEAQGGRRELRAPLTSIKGSAATALRASRLVGPAEVAQFFRIIDEQADRMDSLIGDLLECWWTRRAARSAASGSARASLRGQAVLADRAHGAHPGGDLRRRSNAPSPSSSASSPSTTTGDRVTVAGRAVTLTPTEYELLRALAQGAGRILTHEDLLRQVWAGRGHGKVNPKIVRAYVKRLRHRLGDDAARPAWIVNERGVGYRMPRPGEAGEP